MWFAEMLLVLGKVMLFLMAGLATGVLLAGYLQLYAIRRSVDTITIVLRRWDYDGREASLEQVRTAVDSVLGNDEEEDPCGEN